MIFHLLLSTNSVNVDPDAPPIGHVLTAALLLFGLVLVGMFVVSQVKKYLAQSEDLPSAGFTLADLRALYKSGKMNAEEFEKAKAKVVEAARRAAERQAARSKAPDRKSR